MSVVALIAAGCGSSIASGGAPKSPSSDTPVYGGSATYGIQADPSGGTGGFCLPESQLAISGILVARMFYDTLTVPNADGGYSPWLAKSVTSDPTYTTWTINLRPNVTFSDGSKLDATVVKNNLDAYRGTYPTRQPLLFLFVFENIKDVTVTGPLSVTVTSKVPWPAFPAYLWGSGRIGIIGQAQLDSKTDCGLDLIGTGPYVYKPGSYIQGNQIVGLRNRHYWYRDPANGNRLPYLDQLTLKVTTEDSQIVNGLQSGALDIAHASDGKPIEQIRALAKAGDLQDLESDAFSEVQYVMLNTSIAPFDDINARLALAYGLDMRSLLQQTQAGVPTLADGPFTKGNVGYLAGTGYPSYNLTKAKKYLAKYKADTGKVLTLDLVSTSDSSTVSVAQAIQDQASRLGVKVNIQPIDEGQEINTALGGQFQAILWRNHPGGDPDTQYIWWHSGSPLNFSKIDDAVIDKDLDDGRIETDPAKRQSDYEDLNRRFATQAYNLWTWWTPWTIGYSTKIHGILGPNLPDGKKPSPGLATGHSLGGIWKTK